MNLGIVLGAWLGRPVRQVVCCLPCFGRRLGLSWRIRLERLFEHNEVACNSRAA